MDFDYVKIVVEWNHVVYLWIMVSTNRRRLGSALNKHTGCLLIGLERWTSACPYSEKSSNEISSFPANLSQMLPSNKETTSKIQARVFDSGHLLILRFTRLSLQAILTLGASSIVEAE